MKPSELKNFISVESYYEKTAENYRNCYVAEKRMVSKFSKISIPNFDSKLKKLFWYAVDDNLFRLGSTNPKKKFQPLDIETRVSRC